MPYLRTYLGEFILKDVWICFFPESCTFFRVAPLFWCYAVIGLMQPTMDLETSIGQHADWRLREASRPSAGLQTITSSADARCFSSLCNMPAMKSWQRGSNLPRHRAREDWRVHYGMPPDECYTFQKIFILISAGIQKPTKKNNLLKVWPREDQSLHNTGRPSTTMRLVSLESFICHSSVPSPCLLGNLGSLVLISCSSWPRNKSLTRQKPFEPQEVQKRSKQVDHPALPEKIESWPFTDPVTCSFLNFLPKHLKIVHPSHPGLKRKSTVQKSIHDDAQGPNVHLNISQSLKNNWFHKWKFSKSPWDLH